MEPDYFADTVFVFVSVLRVMKTIRTAAISARKLRIVVADDSTVAREGIAAIIRQDLRYALCVLATDQRTMNELVQQHQPDLLLIEPFFGNRDGIFLIKELAARFPRMRILAVSRQPEEIYAERALRAGASGYWMKTSTRAAAGHGRGNLQSSGSTYLLPLSCGTVTSTCSFEELPPLSVPVMRIA